MEKRSLELLTTGVDSAILPVKLFPHLFSCMAKVPGRSEDN